MEKGVTMERRIQSSDEFFLSPDEAKTAIIEYLEKRLKSEGINYTFPAFGEGKRLKQKKYVYTKKRKTISKKWKGEPERYTTVSHVDDGVLVKTIDISYPMQPIERDIDDIDEEDEDELDLDDLEE